MLCLVPKENVPLSVCWLVCHQNYTKTIEQISTKLVQRIGPEHTTSSFGQDIKMKGYIFCHFL